MLSLHEPRRKKPLVMAVQGWCLTIGIELLLSADIRLAAEGTRFGQIEVNRGIFPFGGATIRLPEELEDKPWLGEFYGKIGWSARAYAVGTLGWYDGNPTHL